MKKTNTLTPENFTALLGWFSPDPDEAGKKYEEVREGLIRYFRFRGCADSAVLADETITRVAVKLPTFDLSNNVKTITYFYGFAKNIFREYLAQNKKKEVDFDAERSLNTASYDDFNDPDPIEFKCLDRCLTKLPEAERDLLLQYYSKNKREKLELRKKLAEQLHLKKGTLHTRVHRLKINVGKCLKKCMDQKNR